MTRIYFCTIWRLSLFFDSKEQEKADYSKGVLERFTRRDNYHTKSLKEYLKNFERSDADNLKIIKYRRENFDMNANNEEFDDGILKYRVGRAKTFRPPDLAHADERLLNALMMNLSPTLLPNTSPQFYAGKIETFLTCRAVATYLKTRLKDSTQAKFFEEASLKAILKSLKQRYTFCRRRAFGTRIAYAFEVALSRRRRTAQFVT